MTRNTEVDDFLKEKDHLRTLEIQWVRWIIMENKKRSFDVRHFGLDPS